MFSLSLSPFLFSVPIFNFFSFFQIFIHDKHNLLFSPLIAQLCLPLLFPLQTSFPISFPSTFNSFCMCGPSFIRVAFSGMCLDRCWSMDILSLRKVAPLSSDPALTLNWLSGKQGAFWSPSPSMMKWRQAKFCAGLLKVDMAALSLHFQVPWFEI